MARDNSNEDAEEQILGIIKREHKQAFWRRIMYSMLVRSIGSVQMVQVEDGDGNVEVFTMQEEFHEAIWNNIHREWNYLVKEAPICNDVMQGVFGYNADVLSGDEVLEGTYWFNPGFDESTQEIYEELVLIREVIPKDSVSKSIQHGEWGRFWA